MSEAPKTVWVAKYALTRGVFEREVKQRHGRWVYVDVDGGPFARGLAGPEWQETREAAITRAEEMKAAKIASLKRQIEKLEALEF